MTLEISPKELQRNIFEMYQKQWEELKIKLYSENWENLPPLNEIKGQYQFLTHFEQVVSASKDLFIYQIKELGPLYRGVGINEDISLDNYERMIPTPNWVKEHNRMNPSGVAFLYLGVLPKRKSRNQEVEKNFILKTISSEIRLQKNDFFTICRFESKNDKHIFDLSGDPSIPTDPNGLAAYLITALEYEHNPKKRYHIANKVMATFYFNLFNIEEVFKPINTDKSEIKKFEYGPFQLLASYFKDLGYAGIKYRSTVHKGGTNLVLFDINDVYIVPGSMEQITFKN